MRVYKLTFSDEPSAMDRRLRLPDTEDIAELFDSSDDVDFPALIEDVTPAVTTTPGEAQQYIGYAHIHLFGEPPDEPPYAACPMTRENLPLLERWLRDNHAALAKK